MSIQAAAAGANWAFEHPRPPRAEGHLNQLYRTQDDRTILMNVLNPAKEYLPLLRSLGIDNLIEDERFVNHRTAYENMSELVIEVRRAIRSMSLVDLRSRFDAHQVTYGFAQKTSEVLDDPQLWANDVLVSPEDPVEGYDRTVSSPIWIDGVEKVRPKLAPEIGEHNEEVLSGIGFTAAEIDNMRIEGVIGNTVGEVPGRNK
jgi:formyl-CoA transferase